MDALKSFVDRAKDGHLTHKRKVPLRIMSGDLESALPPQKGLVAAVRELAYESVQSFEALRRAQRTLMRAAQAYLGFDTEGMDVSAVSLLQASSDLFDALDAGLKRSGLREVISACDRILKEHEYLANLMRDRDEAHREFEHYNEKVAGFMAAPNISDPKKYERNQEKLIHAQRIANERRRVCDDAVRTLVERRVFHARATAHALLNAYARLLASWGSHAVPVAEAFKAELKVGTPVEVIGFPEDYGLNGLTTLVIGVNEDTGECRVPVSRDGQEKTFHPAHLCPIGPAPEPPEPPPPELRVSPTKGPSDGCEAELAVTGLRGPVTDVLVGGERAQILEASATGVRVRMPPGAARGPLRVEVRTDGWQEYVIAADGAFQYYEALGFGPCGHNVELSTSARAPSRRRPGVATRASGLVQAIAITSTPIPALPLPEGTPWPTARRRYFEVEVLELTEQRSTKTLLIGYAWPPDSAADPATSSQWGSRAFSGAFGAEGTATAADSPDPQASPAAAAAAWGRIPEGAAQLPRGFVVGGDLPKAHFAGAELAKVAGWRPLLDVAAGTVIGALLEESGSEVSLTIYQDGVRRCSFSAQLPISWAGAPHGVVDVCGSVRQVELRQGAVPPEDPATAAGPAPAAAPAATADEADSSSSPWPPTSAFAFDAPTRWPTIQTPGNDGWPPAQPMAFF